MPTYQNGRIPDHLLVQFDSGWNQTDGAWHHSLSPATYQRHLMLVDRAKARTGRTLTISRGWSAYRPLDAQILARKIHGNYAAMPGTSSHGGFWEGRQTLAMDYGNWAAVYAGKGGQAAFFEDCRAVGLTPGLIMPERGYPLEPWHVVDLNPWSAVPAGGGSTPFDPEEDELNDTQAAQLAQAASDAAAAKHALFYGGNWQNSDGSNQVAKYGVLPIVIHNQGLIAKQAGRLAAIEQVVEQLAVGNGAVLDMDAIAAAAERGAEKALEGLTLKAV